MSLILDALNRAENERKNHNVVPDINTLHSAREFHSEKAGHSLIWWGAGAVLVIALISALTFVLLRPAPPSQSLPGQDAAIPQAVAVLASGVIDNPATATNNSPANSAPVPVVEATPKISHPTAAIENLYAAEDAAPVNKEESGVSELYAAEAATTASETIVDPFNVAGSPAAISAESVEQAPPRTYDSITNIPDFNSLPWNMRQRVPTISYARHNYLAGGVSSVVINNQTSGVGNIIGTGQFIVQDIYVDGVVLKHGDIVFKLRALNGWINM